MVWMGSGWGKGEVSLAVGKGERISRRIERSCLPLGPTDVHRWATCKIYPRGNGALGVVMRRLYTDVRAVNSMVRKSGPPNAQFAGISGTRMIPRCSPSGANTHTPPEPVQYTRPSASTFMPSGTPSSADAMLPNIRLLLSDPSAATS